MGQKPRVQVHPAIQVEEFHGAGLGDALGQPVVLNAQVILLSRPKHIAPNLQQQQQQSGSSVADELHDALPSLHLHPAFNSSWQRNLPQVACTDASL